MKRNKEPYIHPRLSGFSKLLLTKCGFTLYLCILGKEKISPNAKYLAKKHSVISCFHLKIIYRHQNWVILYSLSWWKLIVFPNLFLKLQGLNPEQPAFWVFQEWKVNRSDLREILTFEFSNVNLFLPLISYKWFYSSIIMLFIFVFPEETNKHVWFFILSLPY